MVSTAIRSIVASAKLWLASYLPALSPGYELQAGFAGSDMGDASDGFHYPSECLLDTDREADATADARARGALNCPDLPAIRYNHDTPFGKIAAMVSRRILSIEFKVSQLMKRVVLTALLSAAFAGPAQAADVKYITDEFEVTMRSGTSTANSIVRMLRSGESVTVLEEDLVSKYSLVETGDNKQGYVLSRFLMDDPAARQSLQELQARFAEQAALVDQQATEITDTNQLLAQEKDDNETLKATLRASEQELAQVRTAARDTLSILEQNKRLQTVLDELRQEKEQLTAINAELSDSTRLDWFVRGGAVSLIAFVVGILVTRIRWKKQDSWGSY